MERLDFIQAAVISLDTKLMSELRDVLFDEYVPLYIATKEELSGGILAEKLCDYFKKVELKTERNFNKLLEKYVEDLDSVVADRIAKTPKAKKNKPMPQIPRARKYYEKAESLQKHNTESKQGLLDYSRIMLCLYASIINNGLQEIDDFELSFSSINLPTILEVLHKEATGMSKKLRFDTRDPYDLDRCSFIILIIMFYYMKSKEITGEY